MKEKAELQQQIEQLESRHYALMQEIETLKDQMKEYEKPQHPTYEDVANEVKPIWFFSQDGETYESSEVGDFCFESEETAEREALRCKWLNIAEYVNRRHEKKDNKHWEVLWISSQIAISFYEKAYSFAENTRFNSEAAAKEALAIMGDDNYKKMIGV